MARLSTTSYGPARALSFRPGARPCGPERRNLTSAVTCLQVSGYGFRSLDSREGRSLLTTNALTTSSFLLTAENAEDRRNRLCGPLRLLRFKQPGTREAACLFTHK